MKNASGHWTPTDVAVADSQIFVTDELGVAVFSADGSLTGRIDKAGDTAFSYPNGVAVRPNGALVVSDTNHGRVVSVEQSGTLLWAVGPDEAGRRVVGLPRGLSVAQNGSILVADAFLFGIQHLSEQGRSHRGLRRSGASDWASFEFPNDVDVRGRSCRRRRQGEQPRAGHPVARPRRARPAVVTSQEMGRVHGS